MLIISSFLIAVIRLEYGCGIHLPKKSLVPAFDNLSCSKGKCEWLASWNATIKLCAVFEFSLEQIQIVKLLRHYLSNI